MASYPGAKVNFSAIVNGVTKLVAALFNSPNDEIMAIETELGTDPAGTASDVKTRLAVSINNDGTLKAQLGAWVDKSASYGAQQAATDGFVVASENSIGATDTGVQIYSDANADPTTLRTETYDAYGSTTANSMCPVKKGDYWKVIFR